MFNNKGLIDILILYILSTIMVTGGLLVNYYNISFLVILGLLTIPLYAIFIYKEERFHIITIVVLAINIALLIPLRGTLVSGDFNIEFISGKITVSNGVYMPDFSSPISAVAVNSLFNPILSIITGVDILQIFRFSAIIPVFLLSITSILFYRILLKKEESFISAIFLITQFYIIEGLVWPARHLYSLALLLLLIYEFVMNRKIAILFSIGVAIYYYAMGYLSVIFILLFTFILAIIYKHVKMNENIRREKFITYGATLTIIIFLSTFLWYSQRGSILSLTGHINQIIRFLSEFFKGIKPEQLGPIERRGVYATHLDDYLTYGTILLLLFISGLSTVDVFIKLIKRETNNINSSRMLAQTFILASWMLFILFSIPLMAGSLGITRVYEVSFIFFAAMIPIGLHRITKIFLKVFKYRHLYVIIISIILLLNVMANAKIFYYMFNEEPLSIMFTKNGIQDKNWRVNEAEIKAGSFLMKYKLDIYSIYGDAYSLRRPSLFWNSSSAEAYSLTFLTLPTNNSYEGYIFLDRYNLFSKKLLIYGEAWTFAPSVPYLSNDYKIYSNKEAEIYFVIES